MSNLIQIVCGLLVVVLATACSFAIGDPLWVWYILSFAGGLVAGNGIFRTTR